MRLTVSNSTAIPSLLAALQDGGCVAAHVGPNSLETLFPWLASVEDAEQAVIEVAFFLRTWEAEHPGVKVHVVSEP
jgi:hypothetical protein